MNKYVYKGPVFKFNKVICAKWNATTHAISKKKAINNLKYQYRNTHGMCKTVPIELLDYQIMEVE